MGTIADNVARIRERIAAAALSAGRKPSEPAASSEETKTEMAETISVLRSSVGAPPTERADAAVMTWPTGHGRYE